MRFTRYNRNNDKAGKIYLNPRSLITKSLVRKMEQNCDKPLKWTQLPALPEANIITSTDGKVRIAVPAWAKAHLQEVLTAKIYSAKNLKS